ncbi:DNA-binding NarL/FixJ family response regulator [Actinoplanes campanulatus]|uniref:DNA-binding NarL/FixJ family response regulator n=1 Tax=Actinoplanes campanulatus TaxID=113559 RepID=A0A7W5ANE7_9ACTN|nr:response regulator transcription factor [Actinoplanes campanulatus]MBB3099498.1 DNA-binding NarL/FixJ family response regulator [Actinoplanes campanulatus]GGN42545.1 DNA-binding response regulator [Actinoplanes campanulatus]GID39847.1 DNA-binding response regulator [Actinoplanes campanulatus]
MTIRVVLVDDQVLVRTGFRMILDETEGIEVVGEAGDGAAAVEVSARTRPDVVLMDVRMPGVDGITATGRIRALSPAPRVIILTTFDLDDHLFAGLRAGASGFLLKDTLADDLIAAVRVVASGEAVTAPTATRRLIAHYVAAPATGPARADHRLDPLTAREREVLTLIARGLSNAEIAGSLRVSEGTVKTHIGRILAKLGLRDRIQAVILGYECGLVTP